MRLIISPPAPPPADLSRLGPRAIRHEEEKNLQTLQTVFQPLHLLTLKTIIREDKYAQIS